MKRRLQWALVLSGGSAKGFMHIGVLKVLESMGVPAPSLVVGTSMGAIVGGLYACGYGSEELEDIACHRFDIRKYLDAAQFTTGGPVGRLVETSKMVGRFMIKPAIDSGNQILAYLEELCHHKNIEDLRIPYCCNAVDLVSGNEVVLDHGSLALAMRASMAFPAFFDPVSLGSYYLVDGGIVNNLPVHIARKRGYSQVLAVDVGAFSLSSPSSLQSGPRVVYRALEVAIAHIQRGEGDEATLTLHPTDPATPLDFARAKHLVQVGEAYGREHQSTLERFFSPRLFSFWKRKIRPLEEDR
ncbi:MAG: patatin-like phospholipase family protein [Termitinemataceae bacterium]